MTNHAILSASSANRWLACPPSARLEANEPEVVSEYAQEGTLAHELCELLIKQRLGMNKTTYTRKLNAIKKNEYFSGEMMECCELYADTVMEKYSEAKKRTKDAVILIEQKLDFSEYVPEGFGTGDAIIIADEYLEVIDFKYGKGVWVNADCNPQMRLYALGALTEFDMLYDIEYVCMTIVQPRIDNIVSSTEYIENLQEWGESIKEVTKLAFEGMGEFKVGPHCKFCKVKAKCKAYADQQMELAKYEFKEGPFLKDEDITYILDRADDFKKWLTAVEDYALNQAVNHDKKWPGYKVVEGRSNRKYTNQDDVVKVLLNKGYQESSIYKPKEILGITAMQKLLGKKTFNLLLADYIIKPPGKPTLVPETDKRPALNSASEAKKDFENN